jgi:hypothetical protein
MSAEDRLSGPQPRIPPSAFLFGHVAHGLSWLLLAALGARGIIGASTQGYAWVHLVTLGWLTLTALSVLFFVIPNVAGVKWRGEAAVRASIFAFALGAFGMVVAFWYGGTAWLWKVSIIVLAALTLYCGAAIATLAAALRGPKNRAAVARALMIVLLVLLATAAIGFAMARGLAGSGAGALALAPVHAQLGIIGWLTLLVMGVSAYTMGAIAGARSLRRWPHIVSNTAASLATALLVGASIGIGGLRWPGVALLGAGVLIFAGDIAAQLLGATVRHRPPQIFMAFAMVWLVVAFGLLAATVGGDTTAVPALIFAALAGWIGQTVVAHQHHIGAEMIARLFRSGDSKTPPWMLLTPGLSYLALVLFQIAVATGGAALLDHATELLAASGLIGCAGWIAMTANVAIAVRRALRS